MSFDNKEIFTITLKGRIEFEPENKTTKHKAQASWKKVAMVIFEKSEVEDYYRWFFSKRFNIELFSTIRGAHVTFINDALGNINKGKGTLEEKLELWEALKQKWHGKEIEVTLNLRPFYDLDSNWERHVPKPLTEEEKTKGKPEKTAHTYHWWLIVDHKFRDELQSIRSEIGLDKPYFGMHMTFGILTQNYKLDNKGKLVWDSNNKPVPIFNQALEHAKYIHTLHEKGFVEINKDYGKEVVVVNQVEEKSWPKEKKNIKKFIYNMYMKFSAMLCQSISKLKR
jgi:hypothetical protein